MIKSFWKRKSLEILGLILFLLNLRLKCCFEQLINGIFKRCQEHSVHLQQMLSVIGCLLSCKKCQMQVSHRPDCLVSETSCITTNNLSVRRFLDWVVQGVSSPRHSLYLTYQCRRCLAGEQVTGSDSSKRHNHRYRLGSAQLKSLLLTVSRSQAVCLSILGPRHQGELLLWTVRLAKVCLSPKPTQG